MTDAEDWLPIQEFPGYSVSPLGWVRHDGTGRLLAHRINQYGNVYVGLLRGGWQQCVRSLPLLVARAFIPQPSEIFDTPINLDGDRLNCRVDNLDWRPRWYAVRYNRQFRERYENPILAPVKSLDHGDEFPDSFSAACHYGLLEREVVLSILNKTYAWPTYQFFELV